VFVAGASGFIGRALCAALRADGHAVVALTRDAARAKTILAAGAEVVEGVPTAAGPWQEAVAGCDAAVNLAGEPLDAERWDARFRQKLLDSRVDATRFLVEAIAAAPAARRPRALVSASGVDYYPFGLELPGDAAGEDLFDETAPMGEGFLPRMCRDWEAEARRAEPAGVRVVLMRTGIVLGQGSRATRKLALPFRLFAGGRVGTGRQWFAWIHLADAVGAYRFALDTPALSGAVNVVAGSVRQAELARALGRALRRPSWLPAPAFAVRTAVGPLAEYLLNGRNVVPAALRAAGYAFRFPDLAAALADVFAR
jgi:hypothetical protein